MPYFIVKGLTQISLKREVLKHNKRECVRDKALKALVEITGENLGVNFKKWRKW